MSSFAAQSWHTSVHTRTKTKQKRINIITTIQIIVITWSFLGFLVHSHTHTHTHVTNEQFHPHEQKSLRCPESAFTVQHSTWLHVEHVTSKQFQEKSHDGDPLTSRTPQDRAQSYWNSANSAAAGFVLLRSQHLQDHWAQLPSCNKHIAFGIWGFHGLLGSDAM